MGDLAEFLLARIGEDEAVAREATPSPWVPDSQGWVDSNGAWIIVAPYHDLDISDEDEAHVTRWQPARILAECEAKRRIVARQPRLGAPDDVRDVWWDLVALLALPYADHPDFREEWRP